MRAISDHSMGGPEHGSMAFWIMEGTETFGIAVRKAKADDRTLGKGVRLTQCPRCKRFADKYVEHDFVVLFIDLVLIKPQVYRHLLFNRLGRDDDSFDPSIIRLGILLLLFDVYLTWARIEKADPNQPLTALPPLSGHPLLLQYLFFLLLCLFRTIAFHLPIRLLCAHPPSYLRSDKPGHHLKLLPYYPKPTAISTALIVSSCTKLFPILLIIWEYDLPSAASAALVYNGISPDLDSFIVGLRIRRILPPLYPTSN
ncbi:Arv1-like protein [Venturia nashicola]|nr:Arv1-like protein [Venturia nashicola]